MNLPGILYNFQASSISPDGVELTWNWNQPLLHIAQYQISYSLTRHPPSNSQKLNFTPTSSSTLFYSPFIRDISQSQYTLTELLSSSNYLICLKVFLRRYTRRVTELERNRNINYRREFTIIPKAQTTQKICTIVKTQDSSTLLSSALLSCFIGSIIAIMLLLIVFFFCRCYKYQRHFQRKLKLRNHKKQPGSLTNDYYKRHRNSISSTNGGESGVISSGCHGNDSQMIADEWESSCTSQMITEALNWSSSVASSNHTPINSPCTNSVLLVTTTANDGGVGCNVLKTPKIIEEDNFYNSFVDKIPEENSNKKPDIILNNEPPTLSDSPTSSINNKLDDNDVGINCITKTTSSMSTNNPIPDIPSPFFRNTSNSTLASSLYNTMATGPSNPREDLSDNLSLTNSSSHSTVISIDYSSQNNRFIKQSPSSLLMETKKINSSVTMSTMSSTNDLHQFPMSVLSCDSSISNDLVLQLVENV